MTNPTASYPRPHEGITGTERTVDDLLALDDKAIARRLLMIGMAGALQKTTLVGKPAPVVAQIYARMEAPRPGDLVMEVNAAYRRNDPDSQIKGFGILIAHREEWMTTDAEWRATVDAGEAEPYERWNDDAWYIQYGPSAGDVCRWTDADFVAIPTSPTFAQDKPEPSGEITAAEAAEELAASGFTVCQLPTGEKDDVR